MNNSDRDRMDRERDFQVRNSISGERGEPSDDRLTQVLVDGKTVFVSTESPPLIPRLKQRSLRGDNSLVEAMNLRLNACEDLIKELVAVDAIRGFEVHDSLEKLKDIADCIDGIISPLVEIENEIDQKRSSIPGYARLLNYHYQLEESRSEGDRHREDELEQKQPVHYRSFCIVFEDIMELIQKARQMRFSLLLDKYQLCFIHYSLLRQSVSRNVSRIVKALESLSDTDRDYREYIPTLESLAGIPERSRFKTDQSQPLKKQIESVEIEIGDISSAIENRLFRAKSYLDEIGSLLEHKKNLDG